MAISSASKNADTPPTSAWSTAPSSTMGRAGPVAIPFMWFFVTEARIVRPVRLGW